MNSPLTEAEWDEALARHPDMHHAKLARLLGVTPKAVRYQRAKRGRAPRHRLSDEEWVEALERWADWPDLEIGKQLGVTRQAVHWQRKKRGLKSPSRRQWERRERDLRWRKLYEVDKLSTVQIAALEGYDPSTVYVALQRVGTTMRPRRNQGDRRRPRRIGEGMTKAAVMAKLLELRGMAS